MENADRNTLIGFGRRVLKNLAYIESARDEGADVHIVTQLIVSLLGLIVFPYEEMQRSECLPRCALQKLCEKGWPRWQFDKNPSSDLHDLLQHVRNAISHRRICISSDDRELSKITVTFKDRPKPSAEDHWIASISGADLREFVRRFSQLFDSC